MATPEEFRDKFSAEWEAWLAQQPGYEDYNVDPYAPEITGHDPVTPRLAPFGQFPPGFKGAEVEYGTLNEFLFGQQWLFVTSTWVKAIQYEDKNEDLTVEYLSGAVCLYHGVTVDMAWDFATAPSKGRWVHEHLIPWDYVLLSVGATPRGLEAKSPKMTRRFGGEGVTPVPGPRKINQFRTGRGRRSYDPSKGTRRF